MRFPSVYYQIEHEIAHRFSSLRPSQQAWLALWVFGMLEARSGTESAVLAALSAYGNPHTLRQRLREGLRDGKDRVAPCSVELEVALCFPALLAWVLALWQDHGGKWLPLALDATLEGEDLVVLAVQLLYRGSGIPLAWVVLPANRKGEWRSHLLSLLASLKEAVPQRWKVVVMTDRGLWSPALWKQLIAQGWHPLMRLHPEITFCPRGGKRRKVRERLHGPGHAFLAKGVAFRQKDRQIEATLIVSWETGEKEPWVLLTDLDPDPRLLRGYGLRSWIEMGFRAIKSLGWQWNKTRRRDPQRVARHWLAIAGAQLWTLACGTREEDAQRKGVPPERMRKPPREEAGEGKIRRTMSLFRRGLASLHKQFLRGRLWKQIWLVPEPWPDPPFLLPNRIICIT